MFFSGGSLTPLQRCSWCILQPQPTGPGKKLVKIQPYFSSEKKMNVIAYHKDTTNFVEQNVDSFSPSTMSC